MEIVLIISNNNFYFISHVSFWAQIHSTKVYKRKIQKENKRKKLPRHFNSYFQAPRKRTTFENVKKNWNKEIILTFSRY